MARTKKIDIKRLSKKYIDYLDDGDAENAALMLLEYYDQHPSPSALYTAAVLSENIDPRAAARMYQRLLDSDYLAAEHFDGDEALRLQQIKFDSRMILSIKRRIERLRKTSVYQF